MNSSVNDERVRAAFERVQKALFLELGANDHWSGELSSSALATAVSVIALDQMGDKACVAPGLAWLAAHANPDGGWGDTIRSKSNLSTTALAWAAFGATGQDPSFADVVDRAERWLRNSAGSLAHLPRAISQCYGKDRTFSVPILMTLALSGRLGPDGWNGVPALPFELAALPQRWFGALQLPVVSYALPALIAIGQTIHYHAPSKNPLACFSRNWVKNRTLDRLLDLQPPNGGFLEATPLTAFVTMSLASMNQRHHQVARRGAAFLKASMRQDGSWPIDTNLATWMTTLAIKAVSHPNQGFNFSQSGALREWLLAQQFRSTHPYTGAAPGGWAWTNLPGGVPDADDTAGALIALWLLKGENPPPTAAIEEGLTWLLNLQNRDGGIPTFCRGWGTLPFDQSAPELTVHAMHAWTVWMNHVNRDLYSRIRRALQRGAAFLSASQRKDGAWVPLWFGNEYAEDQVNPVYGTARTLISLNALSDLDGLIERSVRERAVQFLCNTQLPTAGWGGNEHCPESLEETALAVEALVNSPSAQVACRLGVERLVVLVENDAWTSPTPIGLYFARLWYWERLYPLIFATSALNRVVSQET